MRLRKKAWALPEMAESPLVTINPLDQQGTWTDHFADPGLPLALELGTGKGRFLVEVAQKFPEYNYLGVDLEANALITAKRRLEEAQVKNAHILRMDITHIEEVFPPDSVDTLFIHFCNPWPKTRHHKRRLTHPRMLIQYRKFLKDGAKIWFKTDDQDLYEASLSYFPDMGFVIDQTTTDLKPEEDWTGIITEYEERWRSQGIKIKGIQARKVPVDPEILAAKFQEYLEKKTD